MKHPLVAHPVCIAAIAVLALNDHVLKAAYPSWATGKLSDVAGLVFFPALLAVLGASSRRAVVIATIATAICFTLVKTWVPATDAFRWVLGTIQSPRDPVPVEAVTDPTDLLALPFVLTSYALMALRSSHLRSPYLVHRA